MNTDNVNFGKRLAEFLDFAKISRSEIGKALNVSHVTIVNYIQGKTEPSFSSLTYFFNQGCNVNWLITGMGDKFSDTPKGRALRQLELAKKVVSPEDFTTKYANLSVDSDDAELAAFMREFVIGLANAKAEEMKSTAKEKPSVEDIAEKNAKIQRKVKIIRLWLTGGGDLAQWLSMMKEAHSEVTLHDVMAWEGEILPNEEYRIPPAWFLDCIYQQGINPTWLTNHELQEPFLKTEEGKALKEKVMRTQELAHH